MQPPTHLSVCQLRGHERLPWHQAPGALQLCQAMVAPGSLEPRLQVHLRAGWLLRPGGWLPGQPGSGQLPQP